MEKQSTGSKDNNNGISPEHGAVYEGNHLHQVFTSCRPNIEIILDTCIHYQAVVFFWDCYHQSHSCKAFFK